MKSQATVCLIIPALNEAEALPARLAAVPCPPVDQVIVVDNGSTDDTEAVARAAGATVIREPVRGYGRACLAGLAALPASTRVVAFSDADGSDDVAQLPALLAPINAGEADLVIGSRVLGRAEPGALTPVQRFGNWLATRLIAHYFGYTYTDLGPFRAIRRDALARLAMADQDFGWTVEMQVKALAHGLRVIELPTDYARRRAGTTKISGTIKGAVLAGTKIIATIVRAALAPGA